MFDAARSPPESFAVRILLLQREQRRVQRHRVLKNFSPLVEDRARREQSFGQDRP